MFTSYLQANCRVNCVPDSSWVHCGGVLKATWSGELSDKCATVVFHVYYNTVIVHINVDCETDDVLEHLGSDIVLTFKGKLPQDWTIIC